MNKERIIYLIKQNQITSLTNAEQAEFDVMLQGEAEGMLILEELEKMMQMVTVNPAEHTGVPWKQLAREVMEVDRPDVPVHFLRISWLRYAAVLLLIAGTATFLYRAYDNPILSGAKDNGNKQADILPGGNKAILTLADGSTIVLDSAENGSLAQQGTTKIIKLNSGSLVYQGHEDVGEIGMNTISTPKGGQYQVVLPDGSRVWLNAASSIRFPTAFVKERNVTITGEVYFEITTDKKKPFTVTTVGSAIQVLGTSFNVNAYTNEPSIKTSLISGSVRIGVILLKPGQALLNNRVVTTDIEQDIAWKNGIFNFEDVGVAELMRQIERWYDVKVVYPEGVPSAQFAGTVKRNIPLSDLLESLQKMGVHNKMGGNRTVIIFP